MSLLPKQHKSKDANPQHRCQNLMLCSVITHLSTLHDYYWSTFMSKAMEAGTQGQAPTRNPFPGKHFAPAAHWQAAGTLPDQNNLEGFWA